MSHSRSSIRQPLSSIRPSVGVEPARKIAWRRFLSEPLRPFFLFGWMVSLLGLSLWPLYFAGWIERFPGPAHAYLMIEGFFGAFTIGFLWTALPRMLEVPGPNRRWMGAGAAALGGSVALHLAGLYPLGHLCFLGLLILLIGFGWSRFSARRDLPPPSFILVALGLALGAVGTTLVAAGEAGWLTGFWYRTGRLFLTEYFLLFLVMGIAAFLAPRFLDRPARQSLPGTRGPSKKWKQQAGLAGAVAGVLLAGALLQTAGAVRAGAFVTAVAVTAYILGHVPLWSRQASINWLSLGLRFALLSTIASPWARVISPDARLLSAHLLLLGGFGLLTLVIGARVVYGHSGYGNHFQNRLHALGIVVNLYVVSLALRLLGEFLPQIWIPLLATSASLLIAAHLVWGIVIVPKILRPRDEPEEPGQISRTIRQLTRRIPGGGVAKYRHVPKDKGQSNRRRRPAEAHQKPDSGVLVVPREINAGSLQAGDRPG